MRSIMKLDHDYVDSVIVKGKVGLFARVFTKTKTITSSFQSSSKGVLHVHTFRTRRRIIVSEHFC